MKPLAGFATVNLRSTYQLTENVEIFVLVSNTFNAKYGTFGILGDPTGIAAPGIPANAITNGPGMDNRFVSPAPSISASAGVRVRF